MTNSTNWPLRRRNASSRKTLSLPTIAIIFMTAYLLLTIFHHISFFSSVDTKTNRNEALNSGKFIPTLRNKKILIEITTVGQSQYAYFENVLDSFRDLCEAGAKVSLHITTTNCDPKPQEGDPECPLYGQSSEETLENNYSVEKIDQLTNI